MQTVLVDGPLTGNAQAPRLAYQGSGACLPTVAGGRDGLGWDVRSEIGVCFLSHDSVSGPCT